MLGENLGAINLEEKIWYRIAKVIYVAVVVVWIGFSLSLFLAFMPQTYTDYAKSYITCLDGTIYSFRSSGISEFYDDKDSYLKNDDSLKAVDVCVKHQVYSEGMKEKMALARSKGMPEELVQQFAQRDQLRANNESMAPLYEVSFARRTDSTWRQAFTWTAVFALVGWVIMEIVRRAFLYVVLGREFISDEEKERWFSR